ncbi:MAG: hypothetical protein HUK26_04135 [Duodenibacillus sp.]|nr:hypothetical protein [Duodenibacillus sp.]
MTSRRTLVAAAAAAALPAAAFAAGKPAGDWPPVEGKQYTVVRPPLALDARPVLVHDFFAYTCPHCLQFAPSMEDYAKGVAGNPGVKVVPVPVAWTAEYEIFPRVYYSFEQMGRMDLHLPFWDFVLHEDHTWDDQAAVKRDVLKWIEGKGIARDAWEKVLMSFAVSGKVRQAGDLWKNYGIDATPMVGVGGRYLTAPHMAGTRPGCIDCIEFLVGKILKG